MLKILTLAFSSWYSSCESLFLSPSLVFCEESRRLTESKDKTRIKQFPKTKSIKGLVCIILLLMFEMWDPNSNYQFKIINGNIKIFWINNIKIEKSKIEPRFNISSNNVYCLKITLMLGWSICCGNKLWKGMHRNDGYCLPT